ncbi:MAG: hypothetical protein LBV59_02900 [Sphingobacterium sp.]|nr:hypothetical protein [Sphingobacterium sp.]
MLLPGVLSFESGFSSKNFLHEAMHKQQAAYNNHL